MIENTERRINQLYQSPPADLEFRPLDPRVIGLWRVTNFVSLAILLLILIVLALLVGFIEPSTQPLAISSFILLAVLGGFLSYWYPPRTYRAWSYRIDAKVLETRSGIMFRITSLLPLTRLQHVDLERGPFERAFGLASLVLHTAGTHSSTITIPGLDAGEAIRLRDHLVEIGGDDAV